MDKLREAADSISRVRGATQSLLAQAERVRRGDVRAVLDLMEDALACPLCMCLRQPHRCAECHNWVGCDDCLADWLLRSPTCPICRQPWPLDEGGLLPPSSSPLPLLHLPPPLAGEPRLEPVKGCAEILALLQQLHDERPIQ